MSDIVSGAKLVGIKNVTLNYQNNNNYKASMIVQAKTSNPVSVTQLEDVTIENVNLDDLVSDNFKTSINDSIKKGIEASKEKVSEKREVSSENGESLSVAFHYESGIVAGHDNGDGTATFYDENGPRVTINTSGVENANWDSLNNN